VLPVVRQENSDSNRAALPKLLLYWAMLHALHCVIELILIVFMMYPRKGPGVT